MISRYLAVLVCGFVRKFAKEGVEVPDDVELIIEHVDKYVEKVQTWSLRMSIDGVQYAGAIDIPNNRKADCDHDRIVYKKSIEDLFRLAFDLK